MKGFRTLDARSSASRPGCFLVDSELVRRLEPALLDSRARTDDVKHWRARLPEQALLGDTQPAKVVAVSPAIIVACYSDDLDTCVFLRFSGGVGPPALKLDVDTRLVCVNTYATRGGAVADDIVLGPNAGIVFGNVVPIVAQFISNQERLLARRVRQIRPREWRALDVAIERHREHFGGLRVRDGRPTLCMLPAPAPAPATTSTNE